VIRGGVSDTRVTISRTRQLVPQKVEQNKLRASNHKSPLEEI